MEPGYNILPDKYPEINGEVFCSRENHLTKIRVFRRDLSFLLEMENRRNNEFNFTYQGIDIDKKGRKFNSLVDRKQFSEVHIYDYRESRLQKITYDLPQAVIRIKEAVSLRLQVLSHKRLCTLEGVQITKSNDSK